MENFESLDDLAAALGDGGPFNPNVDYETNEELVDALVNLGMDDKVYVHHDDHLGLKGRLSEDFLKSPVIGIDSEGFESDIEAVLEQANIIIPLSRRELSEDDIEEIREDKVYRGEDPDD